jgi:23S rRNA (cytosine1962-C5)-methyltransferase
MSLKKISLSKNTRIKALAGLREIYSKDLENEGRGHFPGEWASILDKNNTSYLVMVNPYAENKGSVQFIDSSGFDFSSSEEEAAKKHTLSLIGRALRKRALVKSFKNGSRLFYGHADGLPGLIIDLYANACLVQINTAGVDRFRKEIKDYLSERVDQKVYFFDCEAYRKNENLPLYKEEQLKENLEISENGLSYSIPSDVIQKIGFYYDHRDNREKLTQWMKKLDLKFEKGVDLFSYVGAWGLNALSAGCSYMDFVDQGNFSEAIEENIKINNFDTDSYFFQRQDVFKWLDKPENHGQYNLVISDPPAFSKSLKNKERALTGYEKLHRKLLPLLKEEGLMVVASCTQGISHGELDQSMKQACLKEKRKARLLDIGIQGGDHPFSGLNDPSCYIKFLLYFVGD